MNLHRLIKGIALAAAAIVVVGCGEAETDNTKVPPAIPPPVGDGALQPGTPGGGTESASPSSSPGNLPPPP